MLKARTQVSNRLSIRGDTHSTRRSSVDTASRLACSQSLLQRTAKDCPRRLPTRAESLPLVAVMYGTRRSEEHHLCRFMLDFSSTDLCRQAHASMSACVQIDVCLLQRNCSTYLSSPILKLPETSVVETSRKYVKERRKTEVVRRHQQQQQRLQAD